MQVHLANSQDVTNQTILPLTCSLWATMENDPDCIAGMNKIQIKYALAVLNAATSAYNEILTMLEKAPEK